ncbi:MULTISPECIES: hypothetical protein [unclassified Frondihabitans]|uniref:hypothetical protein n=1 Tax=unclassified Frondihabitans TaxID=2626248 RepID=UPI000F4E83B2|nr:MULTISPECIES: hypothetical protein [unclassified Frondihabitans]
MTIHTTRKALSISRTIIDRAELDGGALVFDRLRRGQCRLMSFRTLLIVGLAFKIQDPRRNWNLSQVARFVHQFNRAERALADLADFAGTSDHIETALRAMARLLEPEGSFHRVNPKTGEVRPRPVGMMTLDQFCNRIVEASIPPVFQPAQVQALDSTDVPTPAKKQFWPKKPDPVVDSDYMPPAPEPKDKEERGSKGWPRVGYDGRLQCSLDLDARLGWRTQTEDHDTHAFNGHDLHLLVDAGFVGYETIVYFIRGMLFRPAGTYKADCGIALIDSLRYGFEAEWLATDRGYSYCKAENWVRRLDERGIKYIHDLHANQRRSKMPIRNKAAIWIDGVLFTSALPKELRKLENFTIDMSDEDKSKLREKYERRMQYAFMANGPVRPDGSVQLKGPAISGRLRCPNVAISRRYAMSKPETKCQPNSCDCGSTIVVYPQESARERQPMPFGTTRWAELYGMRTAVESANSNFKIWRGVLHRHSSFVFGTTPNAILLALQCAAINVSLFHDAYDDKVTIKTTKSEHVPPKRRRRGAARALHQRRARSKKRLTGPQPVTQGRRR